jgi:hypothetical protein
MLLPAQPLGLLSAFYTTPNTHYVTHHPPGRPVLVLRSSILTPTHNRPFAVDYSFGTGALLREPLLLITGGCRVAFDGVRSWLGGGVAGGGGVGGGRGALHGLGPQQHGSRLPLPLFSTRVMILGEKREGWSSTKGELHADRSGHQPAVRTFFTPLKRLHPTTPNQITPTNRPPVFALFFVSVAIYNRLELTIAKDDKWLEARTKEKASAALQALARLWEAEAEEVDGVAETVDALVDAGAIEAAQAARHAAEGRLKRLDGEVRAGGYLGGVWKGVVGSCVAGCRCLNRLKVRHPSTHPPLDPIPSPPKAKPLFEALEAINAKTAAAARDLADRGKAVQARFLKLVSAPPRGGSRGTFGV